MKSVFVSFVFLLSSVCAYASDFELPEIERSDFESMSEDLMSNFSHTTVSSARSLGIVWGVEAGVVAGLGKADSLKEVMGRVSDYDSSTIPHAGVFGRVSLPHGLTLEGALLPKLKPKNGEIESLSLGAQWNLFSLPLVHFALKGHFSTSKLSFNQSIGNDDNSEVEFKQKSFGLLPMASVNLGLLEPYAGLGVIRGDSDLSYQTTSTNNLFTFTDAVSINNKETSSQLLLGAQLNLLLLKTGLEYSRQFGTERYSAKFSVAF